MLRKYTLWLGRLASPGLHLRNALLLYILLPMGIVAALSFGWSLRAFERQVEMRMQQDLELVARAIKGPVSHALLREREGSIAEALKSAFAMSHVYAAYLYDAEGRQISDTGAGDAEIDRRTVSEHVAQGERHGAYGEVGGRDVYSYFVPLTGPGGQIEGLLQLTRRYSDFENQIRTIRYRGAGLFLVALLALTGIVMVGHHRLFGRHLARFAASFDVIAGGDVRHRYCPGGPAELRRLGGQFNRMMDDIERAEQEIQLRAARQLALEDRLRQAEKMAAIGELAAGVAHELGTPLSVVDASVQRARRQADGPLVRPLERIGREVRRMEHIIRQLLDFSRRSRIVKRPVKVGHVAHSALDAVAAEAREAGCSVAILPGADQVAMLDPVRVEQALVNLLRNAVQAAPNGRVELAWQVEDDTVAYRVTDNGEGVDETLRGKLFEPFFTTKPVGQGTGLGLAVVHGIAADHGGQVAVSRGPEGGACFALRLPVGQPEGAG